MCGFGLILGGNVNDNRRVVSEMMRLVNHRGPDNQGIQTIDCDSPIVMGHARLAILDLSDNANQPFVSSDSRMSLVYNGEIYNYKELRSQLTAKGRYFRTNSDTEVLLHAYAEWGPKCLNMLNGMFSFVIHDKEKRKLFLARDRFGVKPLYYTESKIGELIICSEAKQLLACPNVDLKMNNETVGQFLHHGTHKLNGASFFDGVYELQPGSFAEIDLGPNCSSFSPREETWYELPTETSAASFEEATSKFRDLFDDALKLRLNADVDVGTGFSGGLDSSAIVFSMYELMGKGEWTSKLRTFSGRFAGSPVDEGAFIEPAVSACESVHKDVFIDGKQLYEDLDNMALHYDEPILTSAVYAQWCVFRSVSQNGVKVTIDGHGADEILGGYKGFYRPRLLELFKEGRLIALVSEARAMVKSLGCPKTTPLLWLMSSLMGHKLRCAVKNLLTGGAYSKKILYSAFQPKADPLDDLKIYDSGFRSYSQKMLMQTSLPAQLQWADRSSMAFGVESRAPFLDYRLVEFCINLPSNFKLDRGVNKKIMRESVGHRMIKEVLNRTGKQGFESPESKWLLEDGFDETLSYLSKVRDVNSDIFPESALEYLDDIVHRRVPYDSFLWRAISLTSWRLAFSV